MSESQYVIALYTIIVGLTATVYVKKWGELLQMRKYALYTTVPIFWSICFFLIVINEWFANFNWDTNTTTFTFLTSLIIPFIYYFIGMLIFPTPDMLDRKDKFAYLDYFEHFLKQKTLIMSLAFLAFFIKYFSVWFRYKSEIDIFNAFPIYLLYKYNYMLFLGLLMALISNNKLIILMGSLAMLFVWGKVWIHISL